MLSVESLHRFYEHLLEHSKGKSSEIVELNQKASRGCPTKFTLHLIKNLELG